MVCMITSVDGTIPPLNEPPEESKPRRTSIPISLDGRHPAVIFGACCSPFIAQFIKNKNAQDHMHSYPKAVNAALFNHYMDDITAGQVVYHAIFGTK